MGCMQRVHGRLGPRRLTSARAGLSAAMPANLYAHAGALGLLEAAQQQQGSAAGAGAVALGPNACWTCKVDRPLRSKHCQVMTVSWH